MLVSPASGVYAEDQLLAVEALQPGVTLRYSFRDATGAEGPWIPFRGPLSLTAVTGEQRLYRVVLRADSASAEIERREMAFQIDKRTPSPPRVLPEPGSYWDPIAVRFDAPAGNTVFYSIQGDVVRGPRQWDGSDIPLGTPDAKMRYVVQAYSVSASGNRSRIVTAEYLLDARPPILDVLSPAAGTFANPQALALSFRDMLWIRYTDDGSDPAVGGIPYTEPVTIRRQGSTTIRIAGQPRASKRELLRREVTVTYTPARGTGLLLDTDSGAYPRGIAPRILSSPGGSVYYTLWEKTPTESDQLAASGIAVSADTGGASPVVLRLRAMSDSGEWGPEYRYFYYVGQGAVTPPVVTVDQAEPIHGAARAQVIGPEDALVSATADGSRPDPRSPAPTSWLDLTPDAGGGPLVVRAVATDGSGLQSPLRERRVAIAPDQGNPPAFSFAPGPVGGTAVLSAPDTGTGNLAYEITSDGSDPPVPGPDSALLSTPVTVTLPFGMMRTFKARVGMIDDSGRLLSVSQPTAVTLSRKPPDRPTVSLPTGADLDVATALTITSAAKVFFTLSSDGSVPRDPDPSTSPSSMFLALPGIDGTVVTYRVKLVSVDAAGNATEVYGPLVYTVDLRPPRLPPMAQIADGGKYNSRQLSPSLGVSPWNVRYTASRDGSVPPDPDQGSALLTNATVFRGEDGAVITWRLKLLAISHDGKRIGERRDISFVIDLQPPEVPRLTGVPAGGRVAKPVVLSAEALPPEARLFYSISTGDADPGDPVAAGALFPPSLTLDVPEGVRRDYNLRIATVDDAGNRSLYDRRYRFTIDRELPDDPEISGAPDGSISARPVTVALQSPEPLTFYELTDDGSMPRLPSTSSHAYSGPLLLTGKAGAAVTYRLLARAVNDLGTASRAARLFTVTIDRTVPPSPVAPSLQYSEENPGIAYLSWRAPASGRYLFRLNSGSADSSTPAELMPFSSPVSVPVNPDVGSTITGEVVSETPAGVRSAPLPFSLSVGTRLPPPVFRGARDGALATQRIELHASAAAGEVRYEISTDGEYPPAVTSSSPLFPDPLVLDAADGQTVSARIAARAFDPTGTSIPSQEAFLKATVDRTPPDPPVASGIDDGAYYQEAKTVPLLSSEGTIYYSLSTSAEPVIPAQTDANRYTAPLTLEARPGQAVTYHIVAFSVSAAGNRSREIRSWTVTIDQKVVYAAPTGNDYADGSRNAPVRSIGRALQIASTTERKTVFAAAGAYPQDSPISVGSDVSLVGGLDPNTWQPLGLERWSTLSAVAPWRAGTPLLSISGGTVSIKGIELASGPASIPALLSVSGGSLSMEQAAVSLAGSSTGHGLAVSGGAASLLDCRMQAESLSNGSLVSITGGTFTASGSRFTGPKSSLDFAAIELAGARRVELKGVTIDPGDGQRTRGIRAADSQVSLTGSQIESGTGAIEAIAVDARGTTLSVENSEIIAAAEARTPTGILASDSRVSVSRSRITVAGAASAVGISARGGELVLSRTALRGAPTREYLSLVRLEDARSLIADNLLVGEAAGQFVGLQVKGGAVDILNNTLVAGTGSTTTVGILALGDRLPRIVNNIVTRSGENAGTAIAVIEARTVLASGASSETAPVMLSNAFGGWQRILRVDYSRQLGIPALELGTVDALNAADGDVFGGPMSGNKLEPASASFQPNQQGAYKLARGSVCLDGGVDLASPGGPGGTGEILLGKPSEIAADLLGNPRPAMVQLEVPGPPRGWDIGAYEYSE
ncbi:MAG: chitobiase/beta-hexosaminidase C-terminal domain-containing protein [Spirochaetia bacterium]